MMHNLRHKSIPNRRNEASSGCGEVYEYILSDVELAYAKAGRLDLVPTADQRGVKASAPTKRGDYGNSVYNGKYKHLTREFLKAEIDSGKTVDQISQDNNIARGTMSGILLRYGLSKSRGARKYD